MKVKYSEFVKSAVHKEQYPKDRRPEFAFVGRSNVGKSTLLNTLLKRKGLAKTSKKPGKTRLINFFDINGSVYFVDLPGYGFARVSKKEKALWKRAITEYITGREQLRMVMHLVDSRHDPTEADRTLLELLEEAQVPVLIVATKADKLKQSDKKPAIKRVRKGLHLDDDHCIILHSSETKEGIHDLWSIIDDYLE